MDDARRLILHLGAHKTASTHFQTVVTANAPLADRLGVSAPPMAQIRDRLTSRIAEIPDTGPVEAGVLDRAEALFAGRQTLLLMDENILGIPRNLFHRRRMYPRAARRIARVMRLFPGCRVEIMLGLRDPASFVPACWAERQRANLAVPFRSFLQDARACDISWRAVVEEIRVACPQARLTIWQFEHYRDLLPVLLARALGRDAVSGIVQRRAPVRVGLSQRALDLICAAGALRGAPLSEAEVEAVMARYPKGADWPGPQPWSQAERALLSARYAADLAALAADPGVQVLYAGQRDLALRPECTLGIA